MNKNPIYSNSSITTGSNSGTRRVPALMLAVLVGLGCVAVSRSVVADAYGIAHPGRHIDYGFELEPEMIVVFERRLDDGPGLGVRGSIPVVFNGFVSSINNSVAITFGFDKDPAFKWDNYYAPVALQWNFWFHRNFSVFGEPGLLLEFTEKIHARPEIWGGARLHFSDSVGLTARLSLPSTPAASLGISFFF